MSLSNFFIFRLPSRDRSFLIRLVFASFLAIATFLFIRSQWLGEVMEHSFVGPKGFDSLSLLLPFLLLFLLFLQVRHQHDKHALLWPSRLQACVATCAFVGTVFLSYWVTHPSLDRFNAMHIFIQHHALGGALIASTILLALMVPLLPALVLFLPWSLIRRNATLLLVGIIVYVALIYASVLEVPFHQFTVERALRWSGVILSIFPGASVVRPERWEIAYRGFQVVIGPVCSGFSSLVLFIVLFGFVWLQLARRRTISHERAAVALVVGLFVLWLLNILRIAMIMVVGSFSPSAGFALFHGAAGAIFFFIVFVIYVYLVVPLLKKPA
ncbi:MAG: exosortase/archaeosortase family protein [Candidatus Peribacteraceae bacterium]|nr:exosortase/archaeosortase family protein [Candidatus Peribacteraceae bacterium]